MNGHLRRFAAFELDLRTGELRGPDGPVPLERQPGLVLTRLVGSAGELVTRGELQEAVWGSGTHVDFDRGLNYCLRQIRIALGENARTPVFIETLPRQGYRFVAAVTTPRLPARRRAISWTAVAAALLAITGAIERGPRNPEHHQIALVVVRTLHDFLF